MGGKINRKERQILACGRRHGKRKSKFEGVKNEEEEEEEKEKFANANA